ncbi:hypothetical protein SLEP1_g35461 [Rubroshorea leprosula]|uniref:Uncharacterized protein n=1 Tax=Rubroshorea leprosula TaxID=152421 RepID=A0AAV5KNT4_9ROSI|nr:hypothetical protein SLEP1_g35461 [Rubroshorea leprosula]
MNQFAFITSLSRKQEVSFSATFPDFLIDELRFSAIKYEDAVEWSNSK